MKREKDTDSEDVEICHPNMTPASRPYKNQRTK